MDLDELLTSQILFWTLELVGSSCLILLLRAFWLMESLKVVRKDGGGGRNRKTKIFLVVLPCSLVLICCLDRYDYLIFIENCYGILCHYWTLKNKKTGKRSKDQARFKKKQNLIYMVCVKLCVFVTDIL